MPPAETEVIAKPKRKPREPKKIKVIAVDVNPTEYFDDQGPPPPSPEEKPKANQGVEQSKTCCRTCSRTCCRTCCITCYRTGCRTSKNEASKKA
ncbi:MAG: hypothetical protein ACKPKO_41225 [Candidatus Fonsibacter sp.]